MYFLKVVCSYILLVMLIDGFTEAAENITEIRAEIHKVQLEIDEVFKSSQKKCNESANRVADYEKLVSDFLKQNFTSGGSRNQEQKIQTAKPKEQGFISKLKNKIKSIIYPGKASNVSEPRLKRCLNDFPEAELTVENESYNIDSLNYEEFRNFILNFVDCLENVKPDKNQQVNGHEHELIVEVASIIPGKCRCHHNLKPI